MADIALFPIGDGDEFDAVLLGGDFIVDYSIRTAVAVSLLGDAEDLSSPDGDPRGWWGDALSSIPGDATGSLWWTLARAKQTDETLNAAIQFAEQALQWMLDDGICSSLAVSAEWDGVGLLVPTIDLVGPSGPEKIKLAYLWQQSIIAPSGAVAPGIFLVAVVPTDIGFSAKLSWTLTSGAVSYQVYMAGTPGTEGGTPTVTTAGSSASIDGLNGGTTYYFRVMALDADGNVIAVSAELSATMVTANPPANLTALACDGHITLNWNGTAGTTYNVYLGTSSGGEDPAAPIATGLTATTYTVNGLLNGTTYYAYVRTVQNGLVSPQSNEISSTPVALVAPTGVTITPNAGQVTLNWNTQPGVIFNVYQGTAAGAEGGVPVASGLSGTSVVIGGLTNCTRYYFKVGAVNACGQVQQSAEVSAVVSAPLGAPSGLVATPGNAQVILNWVAGTNVSSYSVYMGTASGAESGVPVASGLSGTTATITGLTNGTQYFFYVAGVNACGSQADSNEASTTPVAPTTIASLMLADNPTYLWQLNEASGASAALNYGSAGHGADLTNHGATFGSTPLITGFTSASFNGSSSYMGEALPLVIPPMSFAAVINYTAHSTDQVILSPYSRSPNSGGMGFGVTAGGKFFVAWFGTASSAVSSATLVAGTTYALGCSIDSSGNYKFYINGALDSSGTIGNPNSVATVNHYLGYLDGNNDYWLGRQSMVGEFPTVLSASRFLAYAHAAGLA
jgi:phage gp46-like protein